MLLDPTWPEPNLPAICENIPSGTEPSITSFCLTLHIHFNFCHCSCGIEGVAVEEFCLQRWQNSDSLTANALVTFQGSSFKMAVDFLNLSHKGNLCNQIIKEPNVLLERQMNVDATGDFQIQ